MFVDLRGYSNGIENNFPLWNFRNFSGLIIKEYFQNFHIFKNREINTTRIPTRIPTISCLLEQYK